MFRIAFGTGTDVHPGPGIIDVHGEDLQRIRRVQGLGEEFLCALAHGGCIVLLGTKDPQTFFIEPVSENSEPQGTSMRRLKYQDNLHKHKAHRHNDNSY